MYDDARGVCGCLCVRICFRAYGHVPRTLLIFTDCCDLCSCETAEKRMHKSYIACTMMHVKCVGVCVCVRVRACLRACMHKYFEGCVCSQVFREMQPMRTRQERCVLLQLPQHQFTVLCINPGLQLWPLLEGATSFARVWCPSITIRLSLAGDPLRIPGEQHFVEIAFLVEIATQVRKEEILNVSRSRCARLTEVH